MNYYLGDKTVLNILSKKKRYVLRGRNPQGVWEEIEEFEKPVKSSEVMDILLEYKEKGYDSFRLDVYGADGKFEKRLWVRNFERKAKEGDLTSFVEQLKKYKEIRETLKDLLGIKEYNPEDIVATFIYYEELKKQLANIVNPNKSELSELIEIIKALSSLQGILQQQQSPSSSTTTSPQQNMMTPKEDKLDEIANKIYDEAMKKVEEALMPPCMKEKCPEV